jgi:mRNA interferase RelE/StbE
LYTVYITPAALREVKTLPGHVRQRIKRAIDGFANDPRPFESKLLDRAEARLDVEPEYQVWRLRLDKWRIVYLVSDTGNTVDVLAVRKRPPYDYGDLEQLLGDSL